MDARARGESRTERIERMGRREGPARAPLALVYAGTSTGLYAIGIWAPMIIHHFGFSYFELGLVNAIPNLVAVVGMVLWARNSDRTGERRLHVPIACLAAGAGC